MTEPFFRSHVAGLDGVTFDAGLRSFMQRIFSYMGGGLALTGVLAWIVANTALAGILFGSPLKYVLMLAPLGFIMVMSFRMNTITVSGLRSLFWLFCGTMGLSMGSIFLYYTQTSVARAFFITAGTFGAMSLWGYTTKKNLADMGSLLIMGAVGIFIAMLVNMFLASSTLQWVISVMGVGIFTGLTAWDVQRLKQTYAEGVGAESNDKLAIFGALTLYLNFINAFQFLLQLMGDRRS